MIPHWLTKPYPNLCRRHDRKRLGDDHFAGGEFISVDVESLL